MTVRIDAHHHVWDLMARDQAWLDGDEMVPIRRSFGIDELVPLAATSGIDETIVVQTVPVVAETEELLDLATAAPLVRGVVGYVDIAAPGVGDALDELLARPSANALVGLRSPAQDEPDPAWLTRPTVLDGLREIAARGLVYDLLIRTHQLGAAIEATATVPECRFVLDHLAKPDIARGGWEPWARGLAALGALGALENVTAKLSGLVTEASWDRWSAADLAPYVDHALTTFGPDRLMFGSDWPVCTLAASYEHVVATAEELVGGLATHEQAAIFGGNAAAVYGRRAPVSR